MVLHRQEPDWARSWEFHAKNKTSAAGWPRPSFYQEKFKFLDRPGSKRLNVYHRSGDSNHGNAGNVDPHARANYRADSDRTESHRRNADAGSLSFDPGFHTYPACLKSCHLRLLARGFTVRQCHETVNPGFAAVGRELDLILETRQSGSQAARRRFGACRHKFCLS